MGQNFILNTPLPITQDFKSLKEEALAYIQEYGGNEWTNLNASDPGVTIVDQICYALTELGYCNDFSIKDILTESNGKLQVENQFYLPQNILTTSPITFSDYRKYLIDSVSDLRNATIYAENNTFYQVYLLAKKETTLELPQIEVAAYYSLNRCRNINELFLIPRIYTSFVKKLVGSIEISNENEVESVLVAINTAIENYIFPAVSQVGYSTLKQEGLTTNEIFNGPLLQNGWINSSLLGTKKDQLSSDEITELIKAISGVTSVSNLTLIDEEGDNFNKKSAILRIDLSHISICSKGKKLNHSAAITLTKTKPAELQVVLGASVDVQTELPKGRYRDINSYYSIQNTFPEIYAVGASAIISNATQFQIAQSRQLKGYLTLFDQVLANQFSQLANIDKLFSFRNSMDGNPSDVREFYSVKDDYERKHITYPAPYLTFSPSYFYQSIYHIPHIRPLLKDNDEFKLMKTGESSKELEHESWIAYKQNPYNPYMHGLMEYMTDEKNDLTRRNAILDHLLARHGESPLVMDSIIEGTIYSGNKLKDQVILKSLYLQNLGLLSYYRNKAYNFLGAKKIDDLITTSEVSYNEALFEYDTEDFVFNANAVDHVEKLVAADFINYAAIELRLSLLFGLKIQYKNHLIHCYQQSNELTTNHELQTATWLIKQRKGFIFIETNLLWQNNKYEVVLILEQKRWKVFGKLNYQQLLDINEFLIQKQEVPLIFDHDRQSLKIKEFVYQIDRIDLPLTALHLENSFFSIKIDGGLEVKSNELDQFFENGVAFIFPTFLKSPTFINRIEIFLQEALSTTVTPKYYFIDGKQLQSFITAFVSWHNGLIYVDPNSSQEEISLSAPIFMANELINLRSTAP